MKFVEKLINPTLVGVEVEEEEGDEILIGGSKHIKVGLGANT